MAFPMENRVYLNRYRLSLSRSGLPVELNRTPTAVLYRAQEIATGREVALELVTAAISNPGLRHELEAEAAAAREINHVNIPKLYDFGFEGDELVYVTEYYEGPTAAAWVAARGPLPTAAVLRIALQVVDTLGATAFHHIVHHSLNPDNIIFVGNQTSGRDWPSIKVLHWLGVAPILGEMGDPQLANAARFASPEQLHANVVEVPSEIYSLGATMSFLLTGVAPDVPLLTGLETAGSLSPDLNYVPKVVRRVLSKMLQPDPDKRPQDPVALAAYLQECLARVEPEEKTGPPSSTSAEVKPRTESRRRRVPLPVKKQMAVVAAVLLLALVAALALPRRFSAHRTSIGPTHPQPAGVGSHNEMAGLPEKPTAPKSDAGEVRSIGPIVEVPREKIAISGGESLVGDEPSAPAEGPAETSESASSPVVPSGDAETTTSPESTGTQASADHPGLPATNSAPKTASRSSKATKSKARTASKKSSAKSRRSVVLHPVKRAEPVPKLQFGSDQAELVGTTANGQWILAVGDSGKRVIVPPPPGFAQQ